MKKIVSILLVVSLLFSMSGCGGNPTPSGSSQQGGQTTTAPQKEVDVTLKLASAATSGVFFAEGTALENLCSHIDGLTVYNQATNGSGENLTLIKDGSVDIALCHNTTALPAYNGTGNYEGKANKDFVAVGFIWYNLLHVIADTNAGIDSVADVKGKTFSVGTTGSAVELCAMNLLDVYGLTFDDINVQRLATADEIDQMKNHMLNGFLHPTSLGDANVMDIMSTGNAKIVPLDEEGVKKLCEKYNMFASATIPANTYPNQPADISTAAAAAILIASPNADEEGIYRLTKALYENNAELVSYHNSFANTLIKNALDGLGNIPLHPGAERYYKEVGLIK